MLIVGAIGLAWRGAVRWAARRRSARPLDNAAVPVYLRGVATAYPGFWRAGSLDVATGRWQPRLPWGVPVSLAGSQFRARTGPLPKQGLPRFVGVDAMLTYVDRSGGAFQLTTLDDRSTDAVLGTRAASGHEGPEHRGSRGRLAWLRNRLPAPSGMVVLVTAVLLTVFCLLPLIGSRQVDAIVVANRGGSYLCEVEWLDTAHDRAVRGHIDCGDTSPGEHTPATVLDWPRSGTIEDPFATTVIGGLLGGLLFMIVAVRMADQAVLRRRLARATGGA